MHVISILSSIHLHETAIGMACNSSLAPSVSLSFMKRGPCTPSKNPDYTCHEPG